jgi:hypothetical protein
VDRIPITLGEGELRYLRLGPHHIELIGLISMEMGSVIFYEDRDPIWSKSRANG